jgi:hypothetical protein
MDLWMVPRAGQEEAVRSPDLEEHSQQGARRKPQLSREPFCQEPFFPQGFRPALLGLLSCQERCMVHLQQVYTLPRWAIRHPTHPSCRGPITLHLPAAPGAQVDSLMKGVGQNGKL